MHDIHFFQSADAVRYAPMLEATSRTVIEYCRRHGHSYESYVGIRRGYFPWHAAFNRIPMLRDLSQCGFRGWVVYLDADAYIVDLDFDLSGYLSDKADRAAVMSNFGSGPEWAVNSGTFFLNLGHPLGCEIVEKWYDEFLKVSDCDLASLSEWRDELSDQSMLFEILDKNVPLRESVLYVSNELMNHNHSRFARQILRVYYPDLDARIAAIRLATAEVLGGADRDVAADAYPVIIQGLYRVLLGRDPDADGLANYVAILREHGVETGLRNTVGSMVESAEYRAKRALPQG